MTIARWNDPKTDSKIDKLMKPYGFSYAGTMNDPSLSPTPLYVAVRHVPPVRVLRGVTPTLLVEAMIAFTRKHGVPGKGAQAQAEAQAEAQGRVETEREQSNDCFVSDLSDSLTHALVDVAEQADA